MAKFDKVDRDVGDLVSTSTKLAGKVESLEREFNEKFVLLENKIHEVHQKTAAAADESKFSVYLLIIQLT